LFSFSSCVSPNQAQKKHNKKKYLKKKRKSQEDKNKKWNMLHHLGINVAYTGKIRVWSNSWGPKRERKMQCMHVKANELIIDEYNCLFIRKLLLIKRAFKWKEKPLYVIIFQMLHGKRLNPIENMISELSCTNSM